MDQLYTEGVCPPTTGFLSSAECSTGLNMTESEQASLFDPPDHQIPDLRAVEEQESSDASATVVDVQPPADTGAGCRCTEQPVEDQPAEKDTHSPNDPAGAGHTTAQGLRSSMGSPGRQLHSPQVLQSRIPSLCPSQLQQFVCQWMFGASWI